MPDETFTVKELLADLKTDILAVDSKVEALDQKLEVKFDEHERMHGVELAETIRSRNDPAATPVHRQLTKQIDDLTTIVRVHENRWQRIIGVLLVLTFLGVGSLLSILVLLWGVLQRVT